MSDLVINLIFVVATGLIAFHGLTYRNEDGEKDFVRLLFGCISLIFFLRVLFFDLLNIF
ncbi:MAG: hypothetical protein CFH32_00406 [Alphaproteobacteria bacterium MarineAlpha9_Bin2]|nr:MAG: hypothetical protein CFH31_00445 [Alphaproteobacteria bacterium MarineAlpha9_Bin1]PPR30947.1 MAG: hypothetical protein CFH32_00406 [Alphaproteobacteria bacterium MarineAlpha9_Bin2]